MTRRSNPKETPVYSALIAPAQPVLEHEGESPRLWPFGGRPVDCSEWRVRDRSPNAELPQRRQFGVAELLEGIWISSHGTKPYDLV